MNFTEFEQDKKLLTEFEKTIVLRSQSPIEVRFFVHKYSCIPNVYEESDAQCSDFFKWVEKELKTDIIDVIHTKRKFEGDNKPELDDVFLFLKQNILINIDHHRSFITILHKYEDQSIIERIKAQMDVCRESISQAGYVHLIERTSRGLSLVKMDIKTEELDVTINYNDDFIETHAVIVEKLQTQDSKGLFLLHGNPGTGKTSYIRHLTTLVKKKVIFIPPNMAQAITQPEFISLLIENPNSILIIEDAEDLILDRGHKQNSPVAAILNLTDGLLSDCLNIQIVCSFNTDVSNIDKALLRKGRLIARYEFKELEVSKANALSQKLGFTNTISTPQSLANIFNQSEMDFGEFKKSNRIGF